MANYNATVGSSLGEPTEPDGDDQLAVTIGGFLEFTLAGKIKRLVSAAVESMQGRTFPLGTVAILRVGLVHVQVDRVTHRLRGSVDIAVDTDRAPSADEAREMLHEIQAMVRLLLDRTDMRVKVTGVFLRG